MCVYVVQSKGNTTDEPNPDLLTGCIQCVKTDISHCGSGGSIVNSESSCNNVPMLHCKILNCKHKE